jgi:hypothetical protein
MNRLEKRCRESNEFAWMLTVIGILVMVIIALI